MGIRDGLIFFLGTEDMDETHWFYHEVLGLPLYKDQGVCRIYDVPGGGRLGFCTHIRPIMSDRSPIITFLADDVDAMHVRLAGQGIEIQKGPGLNSNFNIYHFFLKDPNGYTLEIQKFM